MTCCPGCCNHTVFFFFWTHNSACVLFCSPPTPQSCSSGPCSPSLSEHQTTQPSPETCQTQLGHLPPHPPTLILFASPVLRAPQTPAGSFDTGVSSREVGGWGGVSIFICLKDSRTLLLPPPPLFLFIPNCFLSAKKGSLPPLFFFVYASHAT